MRFLHVLKRKKILFLNIFLFSYVLINFFDGNRGFFSYLDKKNHIEDLVEDKKNLIKQLNIIEHKNNLLSGKINLDFLDILIREKFKFGHSDEIIIKLNEQN
ncbi:MAG: hypothetical protein CMG02_01870 [Candidatus Marinimicrobia bacterium]|nr:hypothetical protein [Candidatus Neomarinimicrobiota bacterium]RPG05883.1 MAG: hypothetical protein CBE07_000470 [Pelagibacteraceae bacterium TMED247]|tara:strand:+ start:4105 stop:4410 length:306 start_codon:yes stop_codon:yes gene_type:complete